PVGSRLVPLGGAGNGFGCVVWDCHSSVTGGALGSLGVVLCASLFSSSWLLAVRWRVRVCGCLLAFPFLLLSCAASGSTFSGNSSAFLALTFVGLYLLASSCFYLFCRSLYLFCRVLYIPTPSGTGTLPVLAHVISFNFACYLFNVTYLTKKEDDISCAAFTAHHQVLIFLSRSETLFASAEPACRSLACAYSRGPLLAIT
ncbi:unnamed protein product, partial [Amoebophrya sp. A25]